MDGLGLPIVARSRRGSGTQPQVSALGAGATRGIVLDGVHLAAPRRPSQSMNARRTGLVAGRLENPRRGSAQPFVYGFSIKGRPRASIAFAKGGRRKRSAFTRELTSPRGDVRAGE